ncbi:MAG: phenylalanine--tRNA ligase subunit beta [Microthrixaceae bacterium]
MKVVLSWLREFAAIEGDAAELSVQLTDLGMELESVTETGGGLDGIVLAKVLDIREHPDAERIRLVDVDRGDGQPLQICCGASNMSVGDLVPLATIGAVMPGGMEIAKRKMRGQVSNGMLCSARELELGDDHAGILIVDPSTESDLGTSISQVLDVRHDVVLDFDALPNRPDTLSMLGVARDLAAHQRIEFNVSEPMVQGVGPAASDAASVQIDAPDLCGRFTALVVRGVTIGQSPRWMAQRLLAAGMRPINVAVDISNYVMLELGQPTHAYDLAKVPSGRFGVRWARDGETIVTLDDVDRTLAAADGVIVNANDEPIGIAGVMGGASTEISDSTTDVVVESAWWDPPSIAASAERLKLHSEASLRFKRGVDPAIGRLAALRVAQLLVDLAGGTLAEGVLEAVGDLPTPQSVTVSPERINALLGTDISTEDMTAMLERIGFASEAIADPSGDSSNEVQLRVDVPTWRPDSSIEADIAEEVARHYGMANIPKTVPVSPHTGRLSEDQHDKRNLRAALIGAGLSEAMPMPFLAPGDLESFGFPGSGYAIANPLVAEESILRTTLLPGLVKAVAFNESHRQLGVGLFELGRCFVPSGVPLTDVVQSSVADTVLPGESERLGVVLAGREAPEAVALAEAALRSLRRWISTPDSVTELAAGRDSEVRLHAKSLAGLHPGRSAEIRIGDVVVGAVGEIDPRVLSGHGVSQRVAWVDLDLGAVLGIEPEHATEVRVSSYPSSDIDLAFVVDSATDAASVRSTVVRAANPEPRSNGASSVSLVDVSIFDVFRSESLGSGRKSIALHLRFQADDRTLNDAEVSEVRARIINSVESTHSAELRG